MFEFCGVVGRGLVSLALCALCLTPLHRQTVLLLGGAHKQTVVGVGPTESPTQKTGHQNQGNPDSMVYAHVLRVP